MASRSKQALTPPLGVDGSMGPVIKSLHRLGEAFLTHLLAMDILFKTEALRKLCSSEHEAKKQLGADSVKKLRTRLADLRAVARVSELIAGRPHPLKNDRRGQFALDLHGGSRLVFESALVPTPLTTDGNTDWQQVTIVRIVFIGDYHD
jgi:proteic killer suppression protein